MAGSPANCATAIVALKMIANVITLITFFITIFVLWSLKEQFYVTNNTNVQGISNFTGRVLHDHKEEEKETAFMCESFDIGDCRET